MIQQIRRDSRKTNGGYIKGIAIERIAKEEQQKASYMERKARKEEHMRVLIEFIDFFSEKMQNAYPHAVQMVETVLFNEWKKNGIAKELPQANIQIENLLNNLAMYDAVDIAKAIYQEFKKTRPEK